MAKYSFSRAERYAVFTVHNERCWLCNTSVSLLEVEVDHIIPESLIGKSELAKVLSNLGLSLDYDINSFANWMPAHRQCNRIKSNTVFHSSPMIQVMLQAASQRQSRAQALHDEYLTDSKISRAINVILAAKEINGFNNRHVKMLDQLVETIAREHETNRENQVRGKPLFLAPWLEILQEDTSWMILRGPGGLVGNRPKADRLDPSWDCPRCGVTGWSGARCITCGMLDDGD